MCAVIQTVLTGNMGLGAAAATTAWPLCRCVMSQVARAHTLQQRRQQQQVVVVAAVVLAAPTAVPQLWHTWRLCWTMHAARAGTCCW